LESEDIVLLGVALIIVVNRLWAHTALRSIRPAYAAVQGINLVSCLLLFVWKIEGIAPRLDAAIRLFLTGFVAWHMTLNYRNHAKRMLARAHQQQAAAGEPSAQTDVLEGGAGPVSPGSGAGSVLGDDGQDL